MTRLLIAALLCVLLVPSSGIGAGLFHGDVPFVMLEAGCCVNCSCCDVRDEPCPSGGGDEESPCPGGCESQPPTASAGGLVSELGKSLPLPPPDSGHRPDFTAQVPSRADAPPVPPPLR